MKLKREVEVKNPVGRPREIPFYVQPLVIGLAVGLVMTMTLAAASQLADDRYIAGSGSRATIEMPTLLPSDLLECVGLVTVATSPDQLNSCGLAGLSAAVIILDQYNN